MSKHKTQNTPFDLTARPQVAEVVRGLKRLIHLKHLEAGDKLPSQAELRATYGYHNNTLNAAMDILLQHGVITRKRRIGTVVQDPHSIIPGLWRVGITVTSSVSEEIYYAQSLHYMQRHLQKIGADISLFMERRDTNKGALNLHRFDHLHEACSARHLDGVLTPISIECDWQALHEEGLELTHAGAWRNAPAGVVIDHTPMIEDAVERFTAMSCQRLAIVSMKGPKPGHHLFWDVFRAATGAVGLKEPDVISLHGGEGPCGGQCVAEKILGMPLKERPDGLIVLDDRIATGLTAILASSDSVYRPHIAVQTNVQASMAYALPVFHYGVDIDKLTKRAVDNLMGRLLNPGSQLKREYIYPELYLPEPSHMITLKAST